ncbi:PAX3- and PAX7-binding protein 1 [Homalodisca vitripennis]|nr:PAX3- and PAX7-binding protein 1 [Homalodisca vitripennis]
MALQELKEVHRRHTLDRDEKVKELEDLRAECTKIKKEAPTLADRFRFYQDLRGYVTDLVECLDEKVGSIQCLPGG